MAEAALGASQEEAEDLGEVSHELLEGTGAGTGEEEEEVVFRAECKLWKLVAHSVPTAPVSAVAPAIPPSTTTISPVGSEAGGSSGGREAAGAGGGTAELDAAAGDAAAAAAANSAGGAKENGWRWQERGCGILHINRHGKTGAGRMVMRMRGVLKLLLNTPLIPNTKYEKVGQKSVRFVGVDAEEGSLKEKEAKVSLCAFRLNLQSSDQQAKFLDVLQDLLARGSAT